MTFPLHAGQNSPFRSFYVVKPLCPAFGSGLTKCPLAKMGAESSENATVKQKTEGYCTNDTIH